MSIVINKEWRCLVFDGMCDSRHLYWESRMRHIDSNNIWTNTETVSKRTIWTDAPTSLHWFRQSFGNYYDIEERHSCCDISSMRIFYVISCYIWPIQGNKLIMSFSIYALVFADCHLLTYPSHHICQTFGHSFPLDISAAWSHHKQSSHLTQK